MSTIAAAALCLDVGITDGDSIKVRCGDQPQESVRLTQIDTPERKQAFGARAKQALSDAIYRREVQLVREGTDRYKRTLGAVYLDGRHVNFEMVRDGYAWCYRAYLKDKSCLAIEAEARATKRGLWVDPSPVPPWDFRRSK